MKKDQPAYLAIYKRIRDDIENNVYKNGEKLPSKRVLADVFGVSVITVEHAYGLLADEGYIRSEQRRGYFVVYRTDSHFSHPDIEIVHVGAIVSASSEDIPASVYAKAVRRVLIEHRESILQRSAVNGILPLRNAISKYLLRNRGMHAEPDQIIIGSGAEYLYGLIVKTLGRDKIYAYEEPSYEKISKIYASENVKSDRLKLVKNGIATSELEKTKADVLHVTPYRSYPSGVSASASKKKEYLAWAHRTGGIIIEDDYESEFTASTKAEDTLYALDNGESVIYVNTFSKTVSQAIRVGYMVLPKTLLPIFEKEAGFYSCTVPTLDQLILTDLINNGDFERHLNRVRRKNRKIQK